jgi:hypothetical protein
MRKRLYLGPSLALLAAALGCATSGDNPLTSARAQLPPGVTSQDRPAPEITGADFDGKPLKLSDYRGKVVMLDFSATW